MMSRKLLPLALASLVAWPCLHTGAQDLPLDKPDYGYVQQVAWDQERVQDFVWESPPVVTVKPDSKWNPNSGKPYQASAPQVDWPPKGPNADILIQQGYSLVDTSFAGKGGYVLQDPKGRTIASYKCLPPWTLVRTPRGPRPISSIEAGELVLGRGGAAVRVAARTVTPVYDEGLIALEAGARIERLTPNHLVLVRHAGDEVWARADAIVPGDALVGAPRGGALDLPALFPALETHPTVTRAGHEPYVGPVFNLVVPGHAYALEAGLVHDVTAAQAQ